MSYKITTISNFRKEAKRLIKKYPSLFEEIQELAIELAANPEMGTSLGNGCYKIRLSIASKNRGKSGGARVITYVFVADTTVYLLSIYDKSVKATITDTELTNLLSSIS